MANLSIVKKNHEDFETLANLLDQYNIQNLLMFSITMNKVEASILRFFCFKKFIKFTTLSSKFWECLAKPTQVINDTKNNQENNSLKKKKQLGNTNETGLLRKTFFGLDSPSSFRIRGFDDSLVVAASNSRYFYFLREGTILQTFDSES